jgi:uracil-DNA glycosylase
MSVKIHPSWEKHLKDEFEKDYFKKLTEFVKSEYSSKTIYPPGKLIFNAFEHTPFDKVKVVIIGQDPYHGPNQAMGLSFSVPKGVRTPPSLQNIYKEIKQDLEKDSITSGDLTSWADQGVLLLNAVLTVEANKAASHQKKGWEVFTDAVIKKISEEKSNIVFILWGSYAQKKGLVIDETKHFIVKSAHPSPLSAHNGFFGSKPFSKANVFLKSIDQKEIEW